MRDREIETDANEINDEKILEQSGDQTKVVGVQSVGTEALSFAWQEDVLPHSHASACENSKKNLLCLKMQ